MNTSVNGVEEKPKMPFMPIWTDPKCELYFDWPDARAQPVDR
jgi:hypothetical protein